MYFARDHIGQNFKTQQRNTAHFLSTRRNCSGTRRAFLGQLQHRVAFARFERINEFAADWTRTRRENGQSDAKLIYLGPDDLKPPSFAAPMERAGRYAPSKPTPSWTPRRGTALPGRPRDAFPWCSTSVWRRPPLSIVTSSGVELCSLPKWAPSAACEQRKGYWLACSRSSTIERTYPLCPRADSAVEPPCSLGSRSCSRSCTSVFRHAITLQPRIPRCRERVMKSGQMIGPATA